jgi:HEAT repeat protein
MMALISEGRKQATGSSQGDVLATFLSQHPEQADRIKLGLIQLLKADNADFQGESTAPGTYTEDDTEHYAEVVNVVSSLNDERAVPALVDAMTTGGMAQQSLLKYGDKAIGPVLAQIKSSNDMVRTSALNMGIALLEKRNDPASNAQIRELIRSSLADPSMIVRRTAVQQIGCLDDRQSFVPLLKEIARTDSQKLPGKALDGGDGNEFYPVRYDARRVLRDIQDDKKCSP